MNKKLLQELKEKLEKEKDSLKKELGGFAKEDKNLKYNWRTRYPNREDNDIEEEAGEVEEYDNLLSVEHNPELKLKEVNLALEKIENGNYGKCEKCRKLIEEKRLLAYPEAKFCIKCNK